MGSARAVGHVVSMSVEAPPPNTAYRMPLDPFQDPKVPLRVSLRLTAPTPKGKPYVAPRPSSLILASAAHLCVDEHEIWVNLIHPQSGILMHIKGKFKVKAHGLALDMRLYMLLTSPGTLVR